MEAGQEMGETVETVLGMWDGIQVYSSFHTDVKELEYKDFLTSTLTRAFTKADHETVIKNWGRGRSERVQRQKTHHIIPEDHFELGI